MKINIKKIFVAIILAGTVFMGSKVYAASASISATKSSATTGESVTINVSINAAAWNLRVSGNGISGDSIVGYDSDGNNTSTSRSFALNTSSAGTYTITLSGDVTDGATDVNSSINKSVTVTVTAPAPSTTTGGGSSSSGSNGGSSSSGSSSGSTGTSNNKPTTNNSKPKEEEKKSSDATLKDLVVEGYNLYPEFNPGTKEYNIKVPYDITSVNILPTTNSDKATCNVEGSLDNLQVGANEFNIVVTAENGGVNPYKIIVTRTRENLIVTSIKLTYIEEDGNTKELVLTPEFNLETSKYEVNNLSYLVTNLNIEVLANLEDAKIEIVGNDALKEGENHITITVTMPSESEEEDEVLVYEIVVNKEQAPKLTLIGKIKKWFKGITGTVSTWYNKNQFKIFDYSLVICSSLMVLLTIYFIIDYKKYRKLIEKITELTKINNTTHNYAAETNAVNTDENKTENIEENNIKDNTEEKAEEKTNGRHF